MQLNDTFACKARDTAVIATPVIGWYKVRCLGTDYIGEKMARVTESEKNIGTVKLKE